MENDLKLRAWVDEKRKDPKMFYIVETDYSDPRVQSEDSGDDIIKANRLGMKNLKYIMEHLEEWTKTSDPDYYALRRRYLSVLSQYQNYVNHVIRYVGGSYTDNPTREEESLTVYQPVPKEKEEEALAFLEEYVCREPEWLFRPNLMEKTGINFEYYEQEPANSMITKLLLKYSILHKNRQLNPDGLTIDELLDRMYVTLFEEKGRSGELSRYDRALQKGFVQDLVVNGENPTTLFNGVGVRIKQLVSKIKQYVLTASGEGQDALTVSHYKTLYNFITLWESGKNKSLIELN